MHDIDEKINKIKDNISKMWDEFHEKMDAYYEQKRKFDFIEWQHKVKNRKLHDIEREKKKKWAEEREKEKEKEEQKKKYIHEIELCNFLMNYLISLKK